MRPRPENAYRVVTEVVHAEAGETRSATQRRLSDEELGELSRHAHARVWSWSFLYPAVLGTAWIVAALEGKRPWLGALAATAAVWMVFQLWRAFHVRGALRRDAVTGTAIAIAGTPKEPEHEFLPESGVVWTTAGSPAAWRFSPVDRNTLRASAV